jgi:hypothetical protein
VRTPQDIATPTPRARGRGRWWIIAAIVVLVLVLASLRSLASFWTDDLWFSSVDLHQTWVTLFTVKLGLFATFGAIFFVVLWVNLLVCDRLGVPVIGNDPEEELVRRYQRAIRPYARRVYAAIAFVLALGAAAGTIGEWQNWLLFSNGVSFGIKDPQFGKDVGFFVFKLPFLSFLVNWSLVALLVILIVVVVFHYLNGGIRAQRVTPRVRPSVKAHISVILALMALAKAAGYVLARYQLDLSNNGVVTGAGYTDIHARLPAISLLFYVSLAAAAILLWNIRRQGWVLPVLAVGVWAFVALVIGVIYPAVLQALKVTPAQSTLELPYIQRNITATRAAYGIDHVEQLPFSGSTNANQALVDANQQTLNNVRLWDPDPQIGLPTFQKVQDIRQYYTFQSLGVDRYTIGGQLTPALVGVRQLNPDSLPTNSWVNTHLQYTHGIGMALAQANQTTANGYPNFSIADVPPVSSGGLPNLTQPDVYFGLNDPGYVVANSKQAELNYQAADGTNVETHYSGPGGVAMGGLLRRLAFALRLGDFNLLISNLITPQSRIMFVRDVQQMAQKAAPFLNYDADPYAVLVNGHIDWVLDAYTTSANYPYSENASNAQVPTGSGLPGSYNYVRNSVKVVIDAYSGQMTFYAMNNTDPILLTYEKAFPHMFTPVSKMSSTLRAHLRYPEDIFSIQTAMYGRYHVTSPPNFYTQGNAWNISPTAGAGPPSQALAITQTTTAQGIAVNGPLQRMSPLYQVLQEPGDSQQNFTITDAYVPASGGDQIQNLSAFMMAGSDPGQYGQLRVYVTKAGQSVTGPVLADSEIQSNSAVSAIITPLDQHGSSVLLGNILMVPLDQSMLYVRPLYVTSSGNPLPLLKYVIAVFGTNVSIAPTVSAALSDALQASVTTPTSGGTASGPISTGLSAQVQAFLTQAQNDYNQAQAALRAGGAGALGTYQNDIDAMNAAIASAQKLLNAEAPVTSPSTTTTTTKPAKASTTSTTSTTTASGGATTTTKPTTTTGAKPVSTGVSTEAVGANR